MDLEKIKEIIQRKPLFFFLFSLGYLLLTGLIKWGIHPTTGTALFVVGGLLGIYFLDIAEVFFHLNPSPFRSIIFVIAFIIVSLFIVTSSGSMVTSGLVLSLYVTIMLWQIGQWQIQHNLTDWYRMVNGTVSLKTQEWMLYGTIGLFIIETLLFVR